MNQPPPWQPQQPPPYGQQPYSQPYWSQQSPPRPRSRRRLWLTLSIIGGVLLFSCIACSIAVAVTPVPKSTLKATTPTATLVHPMIQATSTLVSTIIPTLTPTQALTQTPKPTPTTITNAGPAVLGGTLNAFIAKFGPPNDHSSNGMPHFQRCGNSNVDQIILSQISLESSSGPITSVLAAACTSTSWNMAQATAVCSSFFPADAKYQRSIQIVGTQSNFASVDKIYYSATLAHVFAADNFTDVNGNTVQAGLFDVDYLYTNNNDLSYIDSCTIQLGTQQTNG